jgi:UDP-N-acetylmuramyl-tripeptide synthetase
MRLSALLRGVDVAGPIPDQEITEVRDDSRTLRPGDLFVAVRGQTVDGHAYLQAAARAGAVAAVVEALAPQSEFAGPQLRVASSARALGRIAANRYGRPAEALRLIGVTGTNGKTTTTFLVEGLVRAAGGAPGVLGTVTYRYGGHSRPAPFTTPTPIELHQTLAEMRDGGCTHVAMECSSHALALDRLEGVAYRVAAFTNLTQDHLDFHKTMESYRDAKAQLFAEHLAPDGVGVILVDGEHGPAMAAAVRGRCLTVSTRPRGADLCVSSSRLGLDGIFAEVETPVGRVTLRSPLIGGFNLENLIVAVGIGVGLGLSPETIAEGLENVRGVPGRLERVDNTLGVGVFVDYAHTPDALERVMAAARPLTHGRLIVVFGCGGDRDRTKRPIMGRAVARDADLAIVTSDNPRTEAPEAIVAMILRGIDRAASPAVEASALTEARRGHVAMVDRRRAIAEAIAHARAGDVVVIAGKGHEDYQIIGQEKLHFDDREEARAALEKLAKTRGTAQS